VVVCNLRNPLVPADTVALISPPLPPETPGVTPVTTATEFQISARKSAAAVGKVRTRPVALLGKAPNIDITSATTPRNAILLLKTSSLLVQNK